MKDETTPSLPYRSDIDGLRALAILPVVFYHLQVSFAPGGFVGVDIFFVISGYLITGLLSRQMQAGTYSIVDFYHRRARRIFPALFFLFACCIAVSLVVQLPYEVETFKNNLIPAALFVSNIHYYRTTDYFAQVGASDLLLHTWSLAVEEQFYIFFPLLLLLVRRLAGSAEKPIFLALTLLSLAIAVWLTAVNHVAAFYLLQSRAWELLIGSLLAIDAVPRFRHRLLAEGAGGLGVLLILITVVTYSAKVPFPGLAALPPCLGAALVLHSSREMTTWTSRLLSLPPLRFIGLISYSLYLWHWPVDVLAQLFLPEISGKLDKIGLLGISIACASFSWYVIERPFRHPPFSLNRIQVLGLSGAVIACIIGAALLVPTLSVMRWHLPDQVQRVLETRNIRSPARAAAPGFTCFLQADSQGSAPYDRDNCLKLASDKPNFLLIGDSHAEHLWVGLSRVYPEINFMEATSTGCKPVIATWGEDRCTRLMNFIFGDYIPKHHLDAIILSARWNDYELADLQATAARLKPFATHVIVMGPTVEYHNPMPKLVAMSLLIHDPALPDRYRRAEQRVTDNLYASAFAGTGVDYISIYRAVCPDTSCKITDDDGLPIEFDYGHFTTSGSIYVAGEIRKAGLLPGAPQQADPQHPVQAMQP